MSVAAGASKPLSHERERKPEGTEGGVGWALTPPRPGHTEDPLQLPISGKIRGGDGVTQCPLVTVAMAAGEALLGA